VERGKDVVRFVAQVRPVAAAVLREGDELFRRGEASGRIDERRRQCDRTVVLRLVDDLLHLRELFGRRRAVSRADDDLARVRRADVEGEVDRGVLRLDHAHEVADLRDGVAADAKVGADALGAGAVDDLAVEDSYVEGDRGQGTGDRRTGGNLSARQREKKGEGEAHER